MQLYRVHTVVGRRDGALTEATRLRNQIHALLVQLNPEYEMRLPTLTSHAGLAAVKRYTTPTGTPLQRERAAAVRRLAQRLSLALSQADELARRISVTAAETYSPLTRLCGVNLPTAGALAGILGRVHASLRTLNSPHTLALHPSKRRPLATFAIASTGLATGASTHEVRIKTANS